MKHSRLLSKASIVQSAKKAIQYGADAVIVTGSWTAHAPDVDELESVRRAIGAFPLLIGSGIDKGNVKRLFGFANGCIVSTSLKKGFPKKGEANVKPWQNRISVKKQKRLSKPQENSFRCHLFQKPRFREGSSVVFSFCLGLLPVMLYN